MIDAKKWLTAAALGLSALATQAFTYPLNHVASYSEFHNYTHCTTSPSVPCVNFPADSNVTGNLSVPSPFPANYSGYFQPTSFQITDGINTYTSGDPDVRFVLGMVQTDATGTITSFIFAIEKWLSGTAPHSAGDRIAIVEVASGSFTSPGATTGLIAQSGRALPSKVGAAAAGTTSLYSIAFHNGICLNLSDMGYNGDPDSCYGITDDTATSQAWLGLVSISNSTSVPTLSQVALVLLAMVLAGLTFVFYGRFKRHP